MVVAVPGATSSAGASPQAITSALSRKIFGPPSLAPTVSAARKREAVDIGAVERRRIDRGDHVVRQHARERGGKRHGLGRRAA